MALKPAALKGLPIRDARTSLILNIPRDDVRRAKPLNPTACAAALACQRQHGHAAIVMRSTLYINFGTDSAPDWVRFQVPTSLQREIVALDRGGKAEPGEYHIRPFCPSARLGAKPFHRSTGVRNGKKTTKFRHVTTKIREC